MKLNAASAERVIVGLKAVFKVIGHVQHADSGENPEFPGYINDDDTERVKVCVLTI